MRDVAYEIVNLAESGCAFFRGHYPATPYFPDDFIFLPWHDDYRMTVDGNTYRRVLIASDVARVAAQLHRAHPSSTFEKWPITLNSPTLMSSSRTILQGLAVEVMYLADACIKRLTRGNMHAAVPWLTTAYQRIVDCARQAQDIIELSSGSGDPDAHGIIPQQRPLLRVGRRGSGRRLCAGGGSIKHVLQCSTASARVAKAPRH